MALKIEKPIEVKAQADIRDEYDKKLKAFPAPAKKQSKGSLFKSIEELRNDLERGAIEGEVHKKLRELQKETREAEEKFFANLKPGEAVIGQEKIPETPNFGKVTENADEAVQQVEEKEATEKPIDQIEKEYVFTYDNKDYKIKNIPKEGSKEKYHVVRLDDSVALKLNKTQLEKMLPASNEEAKKKAIQERLDKEEEELKKKISAVESFDELYAVLDGEKEIKGSQKTYTAKDLWREIEYARNIWQQQDNSIDREKTLSYITSRGSLRVKVRELLEKESKIHTPTEKISTSETEAELKEIIRKNEEIIKEETEGDKAEARKKRIEELRRKLGYYDIKEE